MFHTAILAYLFLLICDGRLNYVEKFDSGLFDGLGAFAGARGFSAVDVHPRATPSRSAGGHRCRSRRPICCFPATTSDPAWIWCCRRTATNSRCATTSAARTGPRSPPPMAQTFPARPSPHWPVRSTMPRPAALWLPAKVIGQVTKLTGSATAIRNGVSITLNVGDNVHKGDVVQCRIRFFAGHYLHRRHRVRPLRECEDGAERDGLRSERIE